MVLEFRCLRKFHISVIGEKYVRNRSVIALYIICVRDYGAKKSREPVINSMYIKSKCEKFDTWTQNNLLVKMIRWGNAEQAIRKKSKWQGLAQCKLRAH